MTPSGRSTPPALVPPRSAAYLVGLAALLTWLVGGWAPDRTKFWDALFDVGHAGLFAVMTGLALRLAQEICPSASNRMRLGATVLALVAASVLTELAQVFDPLRHASVGDVIRDVAGSGIYAALWLIAKKELTGRQTVVAATLSAAAAFAVIIPLYRTILDYQERDRAFPTLVSLDGSRWESRFVETVAVSIESHARPPEWYPRHSDPFALVTFYPDRFAGFGLTEPYPDWTGYTRLEFAAIVSGAGPVKLTVRAQDRDFSGSDLDRFSRDIQLNPGIQVISIELDDIALNQEVRPMQMSQMRRLSVVAANLVHSVTVYFGPFRLTRPALESGPATSQSGDGDSSAASSKPSPSGRPLLPAPSAGPWDIGISSTSEPVAIRRSWKVG